MVHAVGLPLIRGLAVPRFASVVCVVGHVDGSIIVKAPQALLFAAYDNIERMPEWSPMLESVTFVDRESRRSEWLLQVPRPIYRVAHAAGFGSLVRWEAIHVVEPPRRLSWRSISGFQNEGDVFFEPVDDSDTSTQVVLRMTYTLPKFAAPLAQNVFVQNFMHQVARRAMERFRDVMEAETAALLEVTSALETNESDRDALMRRR